MGVILAAGEGVRMEPFSTQIPKPLLPVLNRAVIEHQIALMRAEGIVDVVIVVSRLGAEIEAALSDGQALGVRLRYVAQEEPLGIAHAVGITEPLIDRPFLLMLGDIFFVPRKLSRMLEMLNEGCGAALAVIDEPDPDAIRRNFAVVTGPNGRVTRVIEKPRHSPTRLKGCGVYLFDVPFFDAIRRTPRSALRDEYELTDAIQIFIDDGYHVGAAEVVTRDINLTYPRDLWALNLRELERSGATQLVHESADVDAQASIVGSVIGPRAKVGPVRVEDSVVFAGARVDTDTVRCVVTPLGRVTFEEDR